MGEIKSVKVDNWGAFFLQKLQNFFNKTDYCDLTLQFNDNSQLKVHKLVLSACTDYFNVLEQTCEMIDDILIMPNELQADLVVPIVNFMYTGTLEFELKMYGKLLKTARDMNMTVLLKLLEAHRRTMESGTKQVIRNTKPSPRQTYLNANIKPRAAIPTVIETSSGNNTSQVKRRLLSTKIEPYRKLQIKPIHSTTYTDAKYSNTIVTAVKGPSRFEYEGENNLHDAFESSFDTISYESKPLKEEINKNDNQQQQHIKHESTTSLQFEQLRRTGYNNNKRPAQSILQSPPTKKPNIQDVKEYAEQQRMRKQIAEEYGEEFEDNLDDEFHNADDDEEYISAPIQQPKISKTLLTSANNLKRRTQQQNQIFQKSTPNIGVNIKQDEKPRIVVKDSTSSNVDHAKIISEVLRKYPHLIKNNKNIKLKIMPNASGNGGPQRVVIKKEPDTNVSPVPSTSKLALADIQDTKLLKPSTLSAAQVQTSISATQSSQPRRIDSKIMKALISLGAENTTGPWLCLRCGVNGRPISIPSYRGFRRHLINTHKEKIDPRLCEHCGWRSTTNKELLFHMQMEHHIKCNINFPKCEHCGLVVLDLSALDDHIDEYHPESKEENQQCIYCNKTFAIEISLYNHMKAEHKERAKDDGVIDFSDDEHIEEFDDVENYEQETHVKNSSSKIQILSDINLPKCISLTKTTPDTTILSNVNYIATSPSLETADKGPKFVNAEGNVMELTAAQRDEIISQLEQSGDGVVMVLNDEPFVKDQEITDIVESSNDKIQTISTQQFGDNNMLIVYDPHEIKEKNNDTRIEEKKLSKEITTKEVDEEIKWKNDISQENIEEPCKKLETQYDVEQKTSEKKEISENIKKEYKDSSDLDMKLKLLTGDWTEDEDEDCVDENEKENNADKTDDDKILDILGKNNDSANVADEDNKIEIKEETKDTDLKNEEETKDLHENTEENRKVTEETKNKIDHKDISRDNKNIETEKSTASYSDNNTKYEEVLFSTITGDSSSVKETEGNSDKPKDDSTTTDSTVKNNKNDNDIIDEKNNLENTNNTKNEKLTLSEETSIIEGDDNNSKKQVETKSTTHDIENIEQLENDEYLNKSDENNQKSEQMKSTIKIKDDFDELSQTKTKDEIKNLISEWGDDDDDL